MQDATLELLPIVETHKAAFRAGKPELSSLLGVRLFDRWPTFPEAFASPDAAPEMWGRGYATAAVNAMLRYAFARTQVRVVGGSRYVFSLGWVLGES